MQDFDEDGTWVTGRISYVLPAYFLSLSRNPSFPSRASLVSFLRISYVIPAIHHVIPA